MALPVTSEAGAPSPTDPRTSGQLAAAMSEQVSRLVKDEIALATADVKTKAGKLAVGGAMLGAAGLLGFAALVALLVAGGLGLALVFASWLAALIMGGVFILLAAVLALRGLRLLKRGSPPVPKEALDGLKTDLGIVKQVKP